MSVELETLISELQEKIECEGFDDCFLCNDWGEISNQDEEFKESFERFLSAHETFNKEKERFKNFLSEWKDIDPF